MIKIKDLKTGDILASNEPAYYLIVSKSNSPPIITVRCMDEDGRHDYKQYNQEELNDSTDMLHLIHYRPV